MQKKRLKIKKEMCFKVDVCLISELNFEKKTEQ